ncbi:tetratricopeptide repeat protein [Paucisalibacillus globulus]|uniref:tetratricopeptide repeat protein n=1 Tax=Paucisalibacillus globulus TaxID=351095 RepID=UPI000BB6FF27|nr:tetratricopeptide repeat protein [Paucisalibacillus globulus]
MEKIDKAISLRKQEKLTESNILLLELVKEYPNHPEINYQCAWSFDVLGEETKAVPYYVRAIELGLSGETLEGAMLGLGSTYRTLGDYESSNRTFEKGIELFPNNHTFKVFYAMTLYNLKEHDKAMELLLTSLIDTTSDKDILSYEKAIRFYANKLDQVW